ncbi:MAG: T9SS type A sorting domain-containing protein [bacterium]
MKKIFTLFTFLFLLTALSAQDLPNPGFESWEDMGTYMEPESWTTPNSFSILAGVVTVTQSTDAAEGMYSARLETKDVLGFTVPGMMTYAQLEVDFVTQEFSFVGGVPMTEFVSHVHGKYKFSGDQDSASIVAYSYKYVEGEDADTVAIGAGFLSNADEWTEFTFPVFQISPNTPDTFNIIILSSSNFEGTVGSVLHIDDISVSMVTNVAETKDGFSVSTYPNPVIDRVTFETAKNANEREVSIYDMTGRLVTSKAFNNQKVSLDMGTLPQGMYTYRVVSGQELLKAGSLVKR